jgi:EamA domain-containing membrane protein RarD
LTLNTVSLLVSSHSGCCQAETPLIPMFRFPGPALVFGEAFTGVHALAFGLIWTALAIYSADAYRLHRAAST